MYFVDYAYRNDHANRISTTGFAFRLSVGAVDYRSRTQLINALSSTESDLVTYVPDAKTFDLFRSTIW